MFDLFDYFDLVDLFDYVDMFDMFAYFDMFDLLICLIFLIILISLICLIFLIICARGNTQKGMSRCVVACGFLICVTLCVSLCSQWDICDLLCFASMVCTFLQSLSYARNHMVFVMLLLRSKDIVADVICRRPTY